ncbi:unnamed protein product, partial [Adineta steineri]
MLAGKLNEQPPATPGPRHLWSSDPEIVKIRRAFLFYWIRSSILNWLLILLVALIYLGSGVNPIWHTGSLDVFVTNFDNGVAGSYFVDAFHNTPAGNQTLNWIFQDPSDSSTIIKQIDDGKAWASVYMRAGVSDSLTQIVQSILNGNTSQITYRPSSA